MKVCNTCVSFLAKIDKRAGFVYRGTCWQAKRQVSSRMYGCGLHQERGDSMVTKSNDRKRNVYKDKDGNKMPGVTIPEILDDMVTIIAKREYTWGKYDGLAVKIAREDGSLAIVEVTADLVIKNICHRDFPKLPLDGKFVEKTSKDQKKYFKFAYMIEEELEF